MSDIIASASPSIFKRALYYPLKILFWLAFAWLLYIGVIAGAAGFMGLVSGYSLGFTLPRLAISIVIIGVLSVLLYNRRHRSVFTRKGTL